MCTHAEAGRQAGRQAFLRGSGGGGEFERRKSPSRGHLRVHTHTHTQARMSGVQKLSWSAPNNDIIQKRARGREMRNAKLSLHLMIVAL